MARKHINMETKLAAALLALGHIDYEHSKRMTASQICSLYVFDHYPIRVVDGGTNEPWNLRPRCIREHREKTSKVDHPQIAKQRRIMAREQEHKAVLQNKIADNCPIPSGIGSSYYKQFKPKIPSRLFPKGRKFASRS